MWSTYKKLSFCSSVLLLLKPLCSSFQSTNVFFILGLIDTTSSRVKCLTSALYGKVPVSFLFTLHLLKQAIVFSPTLFLAFVKG